MLETANNLSAPQMLILTTAATRADQMILPLPTSLRACGASRQRLLESLRKRELVIEVLTDESPLSWRQDEAGQLYALKLATPVLNPVGAIADAEAAAKHPADEAEASLSLLATETLTADTQDVPTINEMRLPSGKLGDVLAAVSRDDGATLDDLVKLTGWLPHTTCAALTRLKQRGYPVRLVKGPDRKTYRLAAEDGV